MSDNEQQNQEEQQTEKPQEEQQTEKTEEINRIHVGNMSWNTTEEGLTEAFSKYGNVTSAHIPTNDQGKSRGFGFVEFSNAEEAQAAVDGMNEQELDGRTVKVSLAKPRGEGGERRGGDRRGGDRRGGNDRRGDRRGGYGGNDRRGGYNDRRSRY